MKKVIITGGAGFIGRHLVKRLLSCNRYSIVIISDGFAPNDNFLADKKSDQVNHISLYTADIRDRKTISKIFRNENAETCIHLAAKINVIDSIKNPDMTMDINVKGTQNVLEACYESQINNFIFASSAAVYGNVMELPITENHNLNPLSPYGMSKMLAENHVSSYGKLKKIQNVITLRMFNVYGTGQSSEADVITRFALRLSKRLPPVIYGDGKHTRDFISVDDVVESFLLSTKLMETDDKIKQIHSPRVFNIGTGIPTSINELTKKMIEIFGLDLQPVYKGGNDERVISHSYADITKANDSLHFVPKKSVDVGLKEMIRQMPFQE